MDIIKKEKPELENSELDEKNTPETSKNENSSNGSAGSDYDILENYDILPAVPIRGIVAFPKMVVHFDVLRSKAVNAVKQALKTDRKIFVIAQRDVFADDQAFALHELMRVRRVIIVPAVYFARADHFDRQMIRLRFQHPHLYRRRLRS